jgi:tetratricopeptide (TPR) repeat protein
LIKYRNLIVAGAAVALLIALAVLWLSGQTADQQAAEQQAHASLQSGITLYQAKEYEQAIAELEQVPAGYEHESKARYYEGSAYMMMGDYPTAVERLEAARMLAPADPGIRYALGVAAFKLGNVKLAKGYFASVLEINPMDDRERELQEQARGLMDMMAKAERQMATPEKEQ